MVDLGFWEFAVIFVVIILVFGPERIPELAKTLGNWYAKILRLAHNARRDFERELNLTDLHKLIQEQRQQIQRLQTEMQTVKREFDTDVLAEITAESATAKSASSDTFATTTEATHASSQISQVTEKKADSFKSSVLSPAQIAAASNAELLKQRAEEMEQAKASLAQMPSTPAPSTPAASDAKNNA